MKRRIINWCAFLCACVVFIVNPCWLLSYNLKLRCKISRLRTLNARHFGIDSAFSLHTHDNEGKMLLNRLLHSKSNGNENHVGWKRLKMKIADSIFEDKAKALTTYVPFIKSKCFIHRLTQCKRSNVHIEWNTKSLLSNFSVNSIHLWNGNFAIK